MLAFLGGKSKAWGRLHAHEIPGMKLYGQWLYDPGELDAWVRRVAERRDPVDIDAVVREVMQPKPKPKRKGRAAG
jgi:hypothetical protein